MASHHLLLLMLSLFNLNYCMAFSYFSIRTSRAAFSIQLHETTPNNEIQHLNSRRQFTFSIPVSVASLLSFPLTGLANDEVANDAVQVVPTGDIKKLFYEGRAMESQGNILAAQRLYTKITRVAPRFIYGWSQLGNTQVALGALVLAEDSYTNAINLCVENRKEEEKFGVPRCTDLYLLYLNRGSLRMNTKMPREALLDLEKADELRAKPDAIILQNRARARELNGLYAAADRDYAISISMTSNEVAPFWLRSALVKFQLGDIIGAFDLIRRVENRFPEAPEVRAALATLLAAKGDQIGAQRKYLEIPDKQRLKYMDDDYLRNVISWPPKMIENVKLLALAVGDKDKLMSLDGAN